jgi:CSLREA domain-containing protein
VGADANVPASSNGNPRINLRGGLDLPAVYNGAAGLKRVLEQNLALPTALASADFDEDGVPDLISGYSSPDGGIITLHRGNLYSIYPNIPEAQQRRGDAVTRGRGDNQQLTTDHRPLTTDPPPFLSPASIFEVPESPDFIGAGDFDNDGHWDVVAAARGSHVLYLLPGDGKGGFHAAKQILLPGAVTALVTGEIKRADGLTDVVVGTVGPDGPQVLVFEGPDGALKATPEVIALPAAATALALGQLDDSYEMDLAVAAGHDLLIVHGRDRKLSLDVTQQAEVPPASVDQRSFPFTISSIALGDFVWDQEHRTDIALVADDGTIHLLANANRLPAGSDARSRKTTSKRLNEWQSEILATDYRPLATQLVRVQMSGLPTDDLVVIDGANHQLHILAADAEAGRRGDTESLAASPRSRVTASLAVSGAPIAVLPMRLNGDAFSDLVILKSGSSTPTVVMTASDATITVTTTADDITPNDGSVSLREAITAVNAGNNLGDPDIIAENPGTFGPHDTINFNIPIIPLGPLKTINVGTDASAAGIGLPTIVNPVTIDGYTQPGSSMNTLSSGDNAVLRIELNGTSAGASSFGLFINAGSSTVRGLVINRFFEFNIELASNGGDVIAGNFIGTNVTGTAKLGNSGGGVSVQNAPSSNIGGTAAGARNVISGNQTNVSIVSATMNQVQGNLVGTDVTGTAALGSTFDGVFIERASNNTIGGTTAGARNIISGNGRDGVEILNAGATMNQVQGNLIGTDASGASALGNARDGVFISNAPSNTVGGTASGAGNTIAFNGRVGVNVVDTTATGNAIRHNSIFSNTGLGIDLGDDGVTPNTPGSPHAGPNHLQSWPVLASASSSGGTTTIMGSLNSTPNRVFVLDFFANDACDPSGNGEGQTFLDPSRTVGPTDAAGNAVFTVTLPVSVAMGQQITATATDSITNDTSEFSNCVGVSSCAITCPGNIIRSTDPGQCTAVVTFAPPTIGAGCGTVSCSPPSGSTFPKGSTMVTCSATAGSSCPFTVTVNDTQPPTITCPANLTQSTDPGQCTAVVTFSNPTVNDNCPGVGSPVCAPPSGSTFPLGTTTVTCTVSDASGNPASCNFTVTVTPRITCPGDINVATAASCPIQTSAPVSFTVTASNCPGVTLLCKDQNGVVVTSGQPFPAGTTTVTCTATDAFGDTASCSFNVNVFSFCLQDDSSAGNVVLVNPQTGDYFFCCGGVPIASGRGTLTTRGCIGSIDHIKGDRKVHIQWDTSANNNTGAGTAFVQKTTSGKVVCQITDKNMSNNTCQCSNPPPPVSPKKPPKERTF